MTDLEKLEQVQAISELIIGLQDAQASFIAIFLTCLRVIRESCKRITWIVQ